jgi:hypothetical protein
MKTIYHQDRSIGRFAASNGQSVARGLEVQKILDSVGPDPVDWPVSAKMCLKKTHIGVKPVHVCLRSVRFGGQELLDDLAQRQVVTAFLVSRLFSSARGGLDPILGLCLPLFSRVFPWGISIRVETGGKQRKQKFGQSWSIHIHCLCAF